MATPATTSTPGPLPPTLFSIYRTYKRETSIVIRWLNALGQSAEFSSPSSSGDHDNSAPQEMTVRQIAERARKAASTGKRPPKNIESAFKMVIMNRSRLTKHYETLPSAAQGVQESTERHKIFNETLAEAYGLLFPKLKRSKKGKKNMRTILPGPPTTTSSNTFETLAGLIEQEEHFDISASKFWEEDVPIPETERSIIAEDPIESSIARQAYLGEHQAIVEFTKSIWQSFAAGDISLAAAGWLTNLAQHFVRFLFPGKVDPFNFVADVFCASESHESGGVGIDNCGGIHPGATLEQLASVDFHNTATSSSFVELTHGCGLVWPIQLLQTFHAAGQLPQFTEKGPRRFENFFHTVSKECEAKEAFAVSVAQLTMDRSRLSDKEWLEKEKKICTDRYLHDKLLLASLIKSASQHPARKGYKPKPAAEEIKVRWDMMLTGNIQHPLSLPLLSNINEEARGLSYVMASVMEAHILLETGRAFVHESEKLGTTPSNCRIILLRRVNEVTKAMSRLVDKDGPDVEYHQTTADLFKILSTSLETFLLDKTFDIYSQSPWVAGSYMSAVSELSLWVGLQMLNEQDAFGAVMHLYNMLQQLEIGCPQIPILEQLRDLFKPVIFACKKEPKRDFGNIFELFRGGAKFYKDEFPQGPFQLLSQARAPKYRHALSEGTKISLDNLPLCAHRESFNRLYNLSEPFWIQITGDPKVIRRCNLVTNYEDLFARYPPSELLNRTRDFIRPEYEGTFPLARVNCFAVLRLSQEILLAIVVRFKELGLAAWPSHMQEFMASDLSHVPSPDIQHAIKCVVMVMRIVDGTIVALDRNSTGRGKVSRKQWRDVVRELPPVVLIRETIVKVCEGTKLEDFLWQNV